jgi:hypothetical protein
MRNLDVMGSQGRRGDLDFGKLKKGHGCCCCCCCWGEEDDEDTN